MSELRSVIDGLEAEDPADLHDEQVEEDLAALQRAAERLEVQRLRQLAEIDRRRPWLRDRVLSTTSWMIRRFRMSAGAAAADVRMARALEDTPRSSGPGWRGRSRPRRPGCWPRPGSRIPRLSPTEELLLEAACRHTVGDPGRVVAYWRNAVESRRRVQTDEDPLRERRRLHVSPTVFGMVRIDGDLDPETGDEGDSS